MNKKFFSLLSIIAVVLGCSMYMGATPNKY